MSSNEFHADITNHLCLFYLMFVWTHNPSSLLLLVLPLLLLPLLPSHHMYCTPHNTATW
jgi:hypothetical protein